MRLPESTRLQAPDEPMQAYIAGIEMGNFLIAVERLEEAATAAANLLRRAQFTEYKLDGQACAVAEGDLRKALTAIGQFPEI